MVVVVFVAVVAVVAIVVVVVELPLRTFMAAFKSGKFPNPHLALLKSSKVTSHVKQPPIEFPTAHFALFVTLFTSS